MPPQPIADYLRALSHDVAKGGRTERSHYPTLKKLLESLRLGAEAIVEPKRIDCGAPDFHIRQGELLIGYAEAKDIGLNLDEVAESEQLKRRYLPALANLVLTNYLEFRWYVKGELRSTAVLGRVDTRRKVNAAADGPEQVAHLLGQFLSHTPTGAGNAKDLALRLARLAREIHNVSAEAFRRGAASTNMADLFQAMQRTLIPNLAHGEFTDMFAQTLAYGFFAAWCNHPAGQPFRRLGAAAEIPKTNPLLRQIFEVITGNALNEEPFVGYVDDLVQLLGATAKDGVLRDFGQRTGRGDPVVHFYETFLQAYDPAAREMRGVYYTPEPVVSYMVRSVDHLLRTRFNCPRGLADNTKVTVPVAKTGTPHAKTPQPALQTTSHRVLILDPACGTGTFPFAIIQLIRERFRTGRNAGAWSSYVRDHLLPRIFAFELLMAPYAIAHLKLGMELAGQIGQGGQQALTYDFAGGERLGVYLTNTLEEAAHRAQTLFGPMRVITEEANAAAAVKRDRPIMVVIGNPPYSGHSANKGPWISSLVGDYSRGIPELQRPGQGKWLQDDYVKFLRFGQWRIDQSGEGILAFITNHGYLDNPTFRGMRQQLMEAFTDIYLLDLHGSTKRKERAPDGGKDENVFDIQQGVCIGFFVKQRGVAGPAKVHRADLWGLRESAEDSTGKYGWLASNDIASTQWVTLPASAPAFLWVAQDAELLAEYERGWSLPDAMVGNGAPAPGIVTTQDQFAVSWTPEEAVAKVEALLATQSEQEARALFRLCGQSQWSYERAKCELADGEWRKNVDPVLYRPFDVRYTVYDSNVAVHRRHRVMRHMRRRPNVAIVLPRRVETEGGWAHCLAAAGMADHVAVSSKTVDYLLPLYLYPAPPQTTVSRDQRIEELKRSVRGQGDLASHEALSALMSSLYPEAEYPRWPNLDPWLLDGLRRRLGLRFLPDGVGDLAETFGPEDVFAYIYALLHCPTYRTRYVDFLKRDLHRQQAEQGLPPVDVPHAAVGEESGHLPHERSGRLARIPAMQELQPVRAFVDQVSEGIATLLLGEGESATAYVPVAWLPKGAEEGTVLRVRFEVDEQATAEGKARVQGLMEELGDEP